MALRRATKYWAVLTVALLIGAQSASASVLAAKRQSFDDHWLAFGLGMAGLLVAAAAADALLAKIRAGKIQAFAQMLGANYRRTPTEEDAALPDACSLLTLGGGRKVSNILEAVQTAELKITLFDYEYTIGRQTRQQTISRMQSSLLHLPSFVLFHPLIMAKLADKIMDRKDIDFSDSPVFNEAFTLRSEDEPAVRALFSRKVRQALEASPDMTIEGNADSLFIFREGYRLKPEEFSAAIEQDKKILALFFEAQQGSRTVPS